MALVHTPAPDLGQPAPAFSLPATDGSTVSLRDFSGARGLLVAFICNHCPYVKAIQGRLVKLEAEFAPRGIPMVAINSNDSVKYPDDNFPAMQSEAKRLGYRFPYLWDETQSIARAYGAVCTPDFFLYENRGGSGDFRLTYRGRLDDSWKDESQIKRRELADAMNAILAGKPPLNEQPSSMGCSLKWK